MTELQRNPTVATVGFRELQRLSCKRSFVSFSIAAKADLP
jgi:hypothetical protein